MDPHDFTLLQHLYAFSEQIMRVGGQNTYAALEECKNTRYEHSIAGAVVESLRKHCMEDLCSKDELPFQAAAPTDPPEPRREPLPDPRTFRAPWLAYLRSRLPDMIGLSFVLSPLLFQEQRLQQG